MKIKSDSRDMRRPKKDACRLIIILVAYIVSVFGLYVEWQYFSRGTIFGQLWYVLILMTTLYNL